MDVSLELLREKVQRVLQGELENDEAFFPVAAALSHALSEASNLGASPA